jgi:hypothetical protein
MTSMLSSFGSLMLDYLDVQLHCKLNFSEVLHSVLCVTYVHW